MSASYLKIFRICQNTNASCATLFICQGDFYRIKVLYYYALARGSFFGFGYNGWPTFNTEAKYANHAGILY